MDYFEKKLAELKKLAVDLSFITTEAKRAHIIQSYMDLAFKIGVTAGMDKQMQWQEKRDEFMKGTIK